jgi:glycosyltransferase involved in cell wall biosynthesis
MIWMDVSGYKPLSLNETLCRSHGYTALDFLEREGLQAAKLRWPFSYDVVSSALNVVVHSEYARELIIKYYGARFAAKTHLVRQHRVTVQHNEHANAREKLQLTSDDFVVCAFGFMDYTKLNHMLLEAWGRSTLSKDHRCHLIFVGGEPDPFYNERIQAMLDELNAQLEQPIKITGFADHETFAEYLSVVDIAVQLRTLSRGETSRTVLDCLAHGVPLIVNANGAMAEYPDEVLVKLPDDFKIDQLVHALESLRQDATLRAELGRRGMDYIRHEHDPARTTAAYAAAIEEVAATPALQSTKRTAMRFSRSNAANPSADVNILSDLFTDLIFEPRRPCIYLDISATARNDLRTGIERVARSLLRELLHSPPAGCVVVPVYLTQENGVWRVRKAHKYLSSQDGFSLVPPQDDLVIPLPGDTLFALDLFSDGVTQASRQGIYRYWRASGAKIGFMLYDLLPITHPEFFPPWSFDAHRARTEVVASQSDLVVCISRHVKSEFERWIDGNTSVVGLNRPQVLSSALGADMTASFPTVGLPPNAEQVLHRFSGHPTFLMVGTIEPRKGYLQAILAFEKLWASGIDVNLVIVGYEGWKPLVPEDRRTIPAIVEAIRTCPELNKRLFWLEGISDEYLSRVYAASSCLLATSEGEGYGLPLIEAAQHNLPVIARDLEVFREVAGDAAYYFSGTAPEDLEVAIGRWLDLRINAETPNPSDLRWETWAQSAHRLGEIMAGQVNVEASRDVARDAKSVT